DTKEHQGLRHLERRGEAAFDDQGCRLRMMTREFNGNGASEGMAVDAHPGRGNSLLFREPLPGALRVFVDAGFRREWTETLTVAAIVEDQDRVAEDAQAGGL